MEPLKERLRRIPAEPALADDFPAAVGLAAGAADGRLVASVHVDGGFVIAAVYAVGGLIGTLSSHLPKELSETRELLLKRL